MMPTVEEIIRDPATSYWMRDALDSGLNLDPVDAASDAEVPAKVLKERADMILRRGLGQTAYRNGGGMCLHCQGKIDRFGLCRCDMNERLNAP